MSISSADSLAEGSSPAETAASSNLTSQLVQSRPYVRSRSVLWQRKCGGTFDFTEELKSSVRQTRRRPSAENRGLSSQSNGGCFDDPAVHSRSVAAICRGRQPPFEMASATFSSLLSIERCATPGVATPPDPDRGPGGRGKLKRRSGGKKTSEKRGKFADSQSPSQNGRGGTAVPNGGPRLR